MDMPNMLKHVMNKQQRRGGELLGMVQHLVFGKNALDYVKSGYVKT